MDKTEKVKSRSDEIDIFVGKNIKLCRQMRGLSQQDLAESVGVTFQQVQKYESGANRISASRIYNIAEVLNLNVNDLYRGVAETQSKGKVPRLDMRSIDKRTLEFLFLYREISNKEVRKSFLKLLKNAVKKQK